jgi:hypothetical protein
MKALIINYNRLKLPSGMADWLFTHGVEPIIIDNHSDYPILIEYYASLCPYRVIHMDKNYGHRVIWEQGILNKLGITGEYIVTDPDLDLSGVPDDFLKVMQEGLTKYPQFDKCALSLEINDLPNSPEGNYIRGHEAKYWKNALDDKYFHADTDTTFALYRAGVTWYSHSAIRTNRPYTCKHVPWYYIDFNSLSEEDKYYFRSANDSSSGKIRLIK